MGSTGFFLAVLFLWSLQVSTRQLQFYSNGGDIVLWRLFQSKTSAYVLILSCDNNNNWQDALKLQKTYYLNVLILQFFQ